MIFAIAAKAKHREFGIPALSQPDTADARPKKELCAAQTTLSIVVTSWPAAAVRTLLRVTREVHVLCNLGPVTQVLVHPAGCIWAR